MSLFRYRVRDIHHSITNINLNTSRKKHFCACSYRLRDINILTIDLENVGQGHGGENGTSAVRSQMSKCVFLNFYIILSSGNIRKRRISHAHIHTYTKRGIRVMTIGK